VPVTFAREGRDERRINAISKKKSAGSAKNAKFDRLGGPHLRPVLR